MASTGKGGGVARGQHPAYPHRRAAGRGESPADNFFPNPPWICGSFSIAIARGVPRGRGGAGVCSGVGRGTRIVGRTGRRRAGPEAGPARARGDATGGRSGERPRDDPPDAGDQSASADRPRTGRRAPPTHPAGAGVRASATVERVFAVRLRRATGGRAGGGGGKCFPPDIADRTAVEGAAVGATARSRQGPTGAEDKGDSHRARYAMQRFRYRPFHLKLTPPG